LYTPEDVDDIATYLIIDSRKDHHQIHPGGRSECEVRQAGG
jgi:hypothetical protein